MEKKSTFRLMRHKDKTLTITRIVDGHIVESKTINPENSLKHYANMLESTLYLIDSDLYKSLEITAILKY